LLYPEKLSFVIDGEIETIHDKHENKEFMATISALQKILKGILHTEEEEKSNQEYNGKRKSH
jgi:hypothetical protein